MGNRLDGRVESAVYQGAFTTDAVRLDGPDSPVLSVRQATVERAQHGSFVPGEPVSLEIGPEALTLLREHPMA